MQEEEIQEAFEIIYELMEVLIKKIEVLDEKHKREGINGNDNEVPEPGESDRSRQIPFTDL